MSSTNKDDDKEDPFSPHVMYGSTSSIDELPPDDTKAAILDLEDQAETTILDSLENQRRQQQRRHQPHGTAATSRDGFQPVVMGERPPMISTEATLDTVFGIDSPSKTNDNDNDVSPTSHASSTQSNKNKKNVRFGTLARKVMNMKRNALGKTRTIDGHHRVASMLAKIDEDLNPLILATADLVDNTVATASTTAVTPAPAPHPATTTTMTNTTTNNTTERSSSETNHIQRNVPATPSASSISSIDSDNHRFSPSFEGNSIGSVARKQNQSRPTPVSKRSMSESRVHRNKHSFQLGEFQGMTLTDDKDLSDLHKVFGAQDLLEEAEEDYDGSNMLFEPTEVTASMQYEFRNRNNKNHYSSSLSSEKIPLIGTPTKNVPSLRERLVQTRKQRSTRFWVCWKIYNPWSLFTWGMSVICLRSLLPFALISAAVAWMFYYEVRNPDLDFLPGDETLSWWLNLTGRFIVTFELARFSQWLIIDRIALSTKLAVRFLGPLLTLSLIQSKGWPFICGSWGILNMFLLHGDNRFQKRWLYWTGIEIYSEANSGAAIVKSDEYLRILLCLVIAGMAASAKRTIAGIYFGRKTFVEYKPKLESILNDIILISELAELSEEIDALARIDEDDKDDTLDTKSVDSADDMGRDETLSTGNTTTNQSRSTTPTTRFDNRRKEMTNARWSSIRFMNETDDERKSSLEEDDSFPNERHDQTPMSATTNPTAATAASFRSQQSGSSSLKIKDLLERWDEPTTKFDKAAYSTIHDVLKFRKALTYMDLRHPFSVAFGPASTRDECIRSAQELYRRLLSLSPDRNILSYDVLETLVLDAEGHENPLKNRSMKKLFRPDRHNELSMVAFVQACDSVYKKLRYFRASVGNSSVIDRVLEDIIDGFFTLILGMSLLTFLKFDPWPVLVSMSTLLVTFTFAVGPSTAKGIEGILMIIGRRPFDIGDRVVFADTIGSANENSVLKSWFVEDISLFTTTLRYATTNEVATISNSSISSCRILNCQRSPNAIATCPVKFHIRLFENMAFELFKESLEGYVAANPSAWDSIVFLRLEDLDSNSEVVLYQIGLRSCYSWQDAPRIQREQAQFRIFCHQLSTQLHIDYQSPNPTQIICLEDKYYDKMHQQTNNSPDGISQKNNNNNYSKPAFPKASTTDRPRKSTADNRFLSMLQESHG